MNIFRKFSHIQINFLFIYTKNCHTWSIMWLIVLIELKIGLIPHRKSLIINISKKKSKISFLVPFNSENSRMVRKKTGPFGSPCLVPEFNASNNDKFGLWFEIGKAHQYHTVTFYIKTLYSIFNIQFSMNIFIGIKSA